ncbi:unnamed protein product [Lathyrus oleraceus]
MIQNLKQKPICHELASTNCAIVHHLNLISSQPLTKAFHQPLQTMDKTLWQTGFTNSSCINSSNKSFIPIFTRPRKRTQGTTFLLQKQNLNAQNPGSSYPNFESSFSFIAFASIQQPSHALWIFILRPDSTPFTLHANQRRWHESDRSRTSPWRHILGCSLNPFFYD